MTELITALDFDNLEEANTLCKKTANILSWFKIGSVLFTKYGPESVRLVKSHNAKVFLDLKYHDIPNTVSHAISNAVSIGADMINVHASGGAEMMKSAVESAKSINPKALVIAVTILTSFDESTLKNTFPVQSCSITDFVLKFAELAKKSNLDGVVCSSHEIELIKKNLGKDFLTVVPGIRPSWETTKDDQKRIMTPKTAAALGADFLVVGRPIIKASDPADAATRIKYELDNL